MDIVYLFTKVNVPGQLIYHVLDTNKLCKIKGSIVAVEHKY